MEARRALAHPGNRVPRRVRRLRARRAAAAHEVAVPPRLGPGGRVSRHTSNVEHAAGVQERCDHGEAVAGLVEAGPRPLVYPPHLPEWRNKTKESKKHHASRLFVVANILQYAILFFFRPSLCLN